MWCYFSISLKCTFQKNNVCLKSVLFGFICNEEKWEMLWLFVIRMYYGGRQSEVIFSNMWRRSGEHLAPFLGREFVFVDYPLHTGAHQHAFKSAFSSHQLTSRDPSLSHGVTGRSSLSVPHFLSHLHTILFTFIPHVPLRGDIDFIWKWILYKHQDSYP